MESNEQGTVDSVPVSLDLCRESRELIVCGTYRALSDAAVLPLLTQEGSEMFILEGIEDSLGCS